MHNIMHKTREDKRQIIDPYLFFKTKKTILSTFTSNPHGRYALQSIIRLKKSRGATPKENNNSIRRFVKATQIDEICYVSSLISS